MSPHANPSFATTTVLGGYNSSLYVSQRLHATAPTAQKSPSLVSRRSVPLDGSAPLLLYGYGSYGISMPVGFRSNRLSLLDRGVIFAIAHIRGGGELATLARCRPHAQQTQHLHRFHSPLNSSSRKNSRAQIN